MRASVTREVPQRVVTRVWDEGECHKGGATRVVTRVGMRVV